MKSARDPFSLKDRDRQQRDKQRGNNETGGPAHGNPPREQGASEGKKGSHIGDHHTATSAQRAMGPDRAFF